MIIRFILQKTTLGDVAFLTDHRFCLLVFRGLSLETKMKMLLMED